MAMTAEAIIFAINSAIRLGRNAQRAYAKSLTSKRIVLPLPAFSGEANAFTAQRFFDDSDPQTGGQQYLAKLEKLQDIHERFKTGEGDDFPTDAELEKYVDDYRQLSSLLENEATVDFQQGLKDDRINADELVALLSIRQYTFDPEKHTSPLQMVAGTLVEIGIDYFNRVPGALNEQSATGRTLKHFLRAIDQLSFSNQEAFRQQTRKIVPQLFIAAAETLQELSSDLTHDPKVQRFVQAAGQGIAKDLFARLDQLSDPDNQEEAVQWGRFLLRSTIANAGHFVFETPQDVFRTEEGASALIQATGSVLLDAILQDPDKLNIKDGINSDTLDRMLQSTFRVMAEYPGLIHKKENFQQLVAGISQTLAGYTFHRPDLFPELVRLILEQTGQHLHLFWQKGAEADNDTVTSAQGLMLQAVQLILSELSQPVDEEAWRPRLSKAQLLFVTESLLDEVVTNPAWVEQKVDDKPLLAIIVRTTIDALAQLPRDQRLSVNTFSDILQLNLRTVAANELVLQKIKWTDDAAEETVLQRALDLVFSYVFTDQSRSAGDRYQLLSELLDYVLEVVISRHPNKQGLAMLNLILFENEHLNWESGFNREFADAILNAALDTLAAHPDLITKEAALAEIVSGVAFALDASSFRDPHLFAELVRLTLKNTALNAGLILRAETDEPEFLIATFIRELLIAISLDVDDDGVWQPKLTPGEAYIIVDTLVNELIQHPEWVVEGADGQIIFREVLQSVRASMEELPPSTQLSADHLQFVFALALQTAATSEPVLDKIKWGSDAEERTILERGLKLVSTFIFREMRVSGGEQLMRFTDLLEFVTQVILAHHPNSKGLVLIQLILFGEDDIDYSRGFDAVLATELMESTLRVLQTHPDLLSGEQMVQNIVSDLAAQLTASDLRQPGILPELVRMTLEYSASNAQLIISANADEPRFLLVVAMQDLLQQLSQKDSDGPWRPHLTADSLLLLTENLLEEVVLHPNWLVPTGNQNKSLWNQVITAVLDALANLPKGTRLAPETLEILLNQSLYTVANSPKLLQKVKWGSEVQERLILNKALDLVVHFVYPPNADTSPQRLALFQELLDFVLEAVLGKYPDKRSLLILDLLFFESSVELAGGFNEGLAEDLVAAAADILAAHPELIAKEEVFQKILSDVGGALRASRRSLDHLLPEFIRLVLLYSAGHLESLMRISPNSPRILLAVAIEQILRVITKPPKRGRWRPSLTDEQVLEIIEIVLERVIANPQWVSNDRLVQLSLEAVFTSLGELKSGQSVPYATIHLLVEASLEAVGQRRQLVLEAIEPNGGKKQVVLEYTLGSLFVKLYNEDGSSAGSWTLSQPEYLEAILTSILVRLAQGPADQATADQVLEPIFTAIDNINQNLAFTLHELIAAIEMA